jgi:hypothetical protein
MIERDKFRRSLKCEKNPTQRERLMTLTRVFGRSDTTESLLLFLERASAIKPRHIAFSCHFLCHHGAIPHALVGA